jgi:hypothetical protein
MAQNRMARALIIATSTALRSENSGAKIRLETLANILKKLDFSITIVSDSNAKVLLHKKWDLVLLSSYAAAKTVKKIDITNSFFWFDACDAWFLSRISMFKVGSFRSLFALVRDFYYLSQLPKPNVVTYISNRDRLHKRNFFKLNTPTFVFPNELKPILLKDSNSRRYIFVGDGSYFPNKKAVALLNRIAKKMLVKVSIEIYGANYHYRSTFLKFHGYSDDDNFYCKRDVVVAPIWSGAGIKNKVALPLLSGLTVLTTPEGQIGLKSCENLYVAQNKSDFEKFFSELSSMKDCDPIRSTSIFQHDETNELISYIKENIKTP